MTWTAHNAGAAGYNQSVARGARAAAALAGMGMFRVALALYFIFLIGRAQDRAMSSSE